MGLDEEHKMDSTEHQDTVEQPAQTAEAQTLQQELEKQKKLAEHNLDQWRRTAADLQNYRKRVEKERAELLKFGPAPLISMLLSVLDDFERALQTCPDPCHKLSWTEGVALIERKLRVILEQQGLKEIEAWGKPFDPLLHEVLLEEASGVYEDGHVSEVVQKGYMLYDKVLRPAIVKVARNKAGSVSPDATQTEEKASSQAQAPSSDSDQPDRK